MNELPKFSVIIAAYNQTEHVLAAVESVKAQTYQAHEIIVVNDGSTDGTGDALRKAYPEICVIDQLNRGKCVARNTGIAHATGDYVCLLDHDDLWHKEKLAKVQVYLAKNPSCEAVNHPIWFFSTTPEGSESLYGLQRDFVAANLEECHQAVSTGVTSANDFDFLNINGHSFKLLLERNRGVLSGSVVKRDTLIRAGVFVRCKLTAKIGLCS